MKKILSLLCIVALLVTVTACAKKNEETVDRSGTTVAGKVTSINDSVVELTLGTLEESAEDKTPPEMPSGNGSSENGSGAPDGTSPAKPDDDSSDGNDENGGTPPEMPSGDQNGSGENGGTPPEMPNGKGGATFTAGDETASVDLSSATVTKNSETVSVSDIAVGDVLKITFNDENTASAVEIVNVGTNGGNGNFGGSGEVTQGSSANTVSEDGTISGATYSSTGDDENALRIDGATVTLDGITVNKSAGATSNTENGDFYGVNAALLATNGATVTIKNSTITSSVQNGNGVFSYGSGTTVNISNSKITTSADNSGGIQTTGGGTTNASDLEVETSGNSSAAIRSDRGGGTVNVDGGTYTSNGYNSPAVYSTAAISVKNATLTANNSEALVIEGKNSITLENCVVSGNMSDTKGTSSDENVHNVMIYQSMSGDADVGTSTFSMSGGSLTSNNGDMFYVTNTHCVMTLSGVSLIQKDSDGLLLRVCGNSASHGWGTAGKNGAQVELTADAQTLNGNIEVDTISTLALTLKNGSTFNGTLNIVENAEGGTAVSDNAVVTVESGCVWNLTGNCTVSSLTNNGTINFNGYTITLADGTVLK